MESFVVELACRYKTCALTQEVGIELATKTKRENIVAPRFESVFGDAVHLLVLEYVSENVAEVGVARCGNGITHSQR